MNAVFDRQSKQLTKNGHSNFYQKRRVYYGDVQFTYDCNFLLYVARHIDWSNKL